ncbi:MAG: ferritin family protein [Desulfatitalea sp.]|nr:ferritin family protein [Desulfatitalea sp.]NNJ99179.1 ferritin family protein [Desulfatitalea sp.]
MPTQHPMETLKEALLLEQRGRAFYQKMAEHSRIASVSEFFKTMAEEETRHIRILNEQFKAVAKQKQYDAPNLEKNGHSSVANAVLSNTLKSQIRAASFEAAAIAAAMHMEEMTVNLYAERARNAKDPNEKAFYRWLTEWEHTHLSFLVKLEQEIREAVWNDRQFWPF